MLHEWTLKTLRYVKEVRQKQPHVIWFYLNKIFRIYFILLLFGTVCKNNYFLKIWFLKYPLKSTVPKIFLDIYLELPGWCSGQESAYQCRRHGSIPGLGRSPAGENGTHSSILAWKIPWTEEPGATAHRVAKSRTQPGTHSSSSRHLLPYSSFQMLTRLHEFCFHLETILIVNIYFRTLFGTNF